MLEKPNLEDVRVVETLRAAYDLDITHVKFLALGNDLNSAAYQAVAADGTRYFLKLRKGGFEEVTVAGPHYLNRQGIRQVMAPIETRTQQLWTRIGAFYAALYPFIQGHNAFDGPMDDPYWMELGSALHAIHNTHLPDALLNQMPRETYTPHWRDRLHQYHANTLGPIHDNTTDPAAARLIEFWRTNAAEIKAILERAEQLALRMPARNLPFVLCHTDIHAGNVLISTAGEFYLVDWDGPQMAPKERDLMFVGGGIGDVWNEPHQADLFYSGYGPAEVDLVAVAYYRYERIVQDMVEFYHQIFHTTAIAEDKAAGVGYFIGSFRPNNVVEIAHRSYAMLNFPSP